MPRGATPGRNLGKEVATGYSGLVVDTAHGGPRRHHAADRRGSAVFVTWENEDPDCGIIASGPLFFKIIFSGQVGESLVQTLGEVADPGVGGPGCQGGGDGAQVVLSACRGHPRQDVQRAVAAVERLVEVSRLTGDDGQAEPDGTGVDVVGYVARLLASPQRGLRVVQVSEDLGGVGRKAAVCDIGDPHRIMGSGLGLVQQCPCPAERGGCRCRVSEAAEGACLPSDYENHLAEPPQRTEQGLVSAQRGPPCRSDRSTAIGQLPQRPVQGCARPVRRRSRHAQGR